MLTTHRARAPALLRALLRPRGGRAGPRDVGRRRRDPAGRARAVVLREARVPRGDDGHPDDDEVAELRQGTVSVASVIRARCRRADPGSSLPLSAVRCPLSAVCCLLSAVRCPLRAVSGHGLFTAQAVGVGMLFVHGMGAIICRSLQPGEQWIGEHRCCFSFSRAAL